MGTESSHLNKYTEDLLCASATVGDAKVTKTVNIDKLILKLISECKWPRITKAIITKLEGLLSKFKI